jgi:hypothetical protein
MRLGYHRSVLLMTMFEDRALHVPQAAGWTTATRVAVIGAGFAWFIERMNAHGYNNLIGVDTSSFIQGKKSQTEEADINAAITAVGLIPSAGEGQAVKAKLFDGGPRSRVTVLNEDGRNNASRNRIRNALGSVDIVYTENVMEALTDAEATQLATLLRNLAPCVHLLSVRNPGNVSGLLNWHSLAEWKAVLSPDKVIDDSTYAVL